MFKKLALLLSVLIFDGKASAEMVMLNPSKDNTLIQQSNPLTQLSNGQGDIFVGRTNQDGQGPATISSRRGLIAFDLVGAIPTGSLITGVSLSVRDVMGLNGDPAVELHRLLRDWGEGSSFQNGGMGAAATTGDATWLYSSYVAGSSGNPPSGPLWSSPGGDFSSTISANAIISDDLGGGQVFSWSSSSNAQMRADVQFWLDNPGSNFGWILLGDESRGQSAKRLNSGESANPPVLLITYTAVPEASTLVLTTAGVLLVAVGRLRRRKNVTRI